MLQKCLKYKIMKRLVFALSGLVLFSLPLFSQLSGDGTSANPYTGTIGSNTTWIPGDFPTDTIYAGDISVTGGAVLTISFGIFNGGMVLFGPGSTLTIGSGSSVIINPGNAIDVPAIANSGTLRLNSYAGEEGVASLIHDSYTSTGGTAEIRLFLLGGTSSGGDPIWHYVSLPVTGITAASFNTNNLVQYVESLVTTADNYTGWVAYDGYQYSTGNTLPAYSFSTLDIGKGYNYYYGSDQTFTITGTFNIADQAIPLTCGTGFPDYQGYNLIGNPFAATIDWNSVTVPVDVNDAIYFTNNGTISSYVNGIGDLGGTGSIPPLQGFFVKAEANSSITLPASARTYDQFQLRYKKGIEATTSGSDTISFVRLKIGNPSDSTELVVRFNAKATYGFDKQFDAYKFSKTSGAVSMWTSTGTISYSINGLPFPETSIDLPVGVNVKVAGTYRVSSPELNKLDNYNITLKDINTGQTVDLKSGGSIDFNASTGLTESRFILTITNKLTGVSGPETSGEGFKIFASRGKINVVLLSEDYDNTFGSITIYDVSGNRILQKNVIWNFGETPVQLGTGSFVNGIYLVEVKSGVHRVVKKISLTGQL